MRSGFCGLRQRQRQLRYFFALFGIGVPFAPPAALSLPYRCLYRRYIGQPPVYTTRHIRDLGRVHTSATIKRISPYGEWTLEGRRRSWVYG